ncbi:MAG: hypothetical protein HY721_07515 [Planctomycetes bacterium]|nr:hypothetical protein [Planctomycetota bacterium]
MGLRRIGFVWLPLLPALCLGAERPDLEPVRIAVGLLTSPVKAERAEGERLLAENAEAYRSVLLRALREAEPSEQTRAARFLRRIVSPWARAAVRDKLTSSYVSRVHRPVDRPLAHPWSPAARRAALEALVRLLDPRGPSREDPLVYEAVEHLLVLLIEVGDGGTLEALASLLSKEGRMPFGEGILRSAERMLGLPPSLEKYESTNFDAAKPAFLKWRLEHTGADRAAKLRATVERWGPLLADGGLGSWLAHYDLQEALAHVEPVVRLGHAAVPAIAEQKAKAKDLGSQGRWELILAAITGVEDGELVRRLLAGGEEEKSLACNVVAAAGSGAWRKELEALLKDGPDGVRMNAACALVACHGKEALPALREALRVEWHTWIAGLAEELDEVRE